MSELLLSKLGVFDPFLEGLYLKMEAIRRNSSRAKELLEKIEKRINRESIIPSTIRIIGLITKGALEFLSSEKRPHKFQFLAHDLRNPLTVISLRVPLVNEYLKKENYEAVRNSFEEMEIASSKSQDMITAANRKVAGEEEGLDAAAGIERKMEDLIRSASEMVANKKKGDFQVYLNITPLTIRRYVSDLDRVLQNLIGNAFEAIAGKDYKDGDPSLKIYSSIVRKEDILKIEIEDNGIGMTPDVLENAFEKRFSTKKEKGDKGLGLYYCRKIVGKMGGSLVCESIPGKRTVFILEIPLEAIQ
ncbi:MAG: histidine kinase [uncultured bacterium]|nr:MAG: histidine kinase [uncultured bacterium]